MQEAQRYHHETDHDHHETLKLARYLRRDKHNSLFDPNANALFDPILEEYILPPKTLMQLKALEKDVAEGEVVLREDLLKHHKKGSLFSSHYGAMYDPILQEYILPSTTMMELKALKEDMIKKRQLFEEMKVRRDHNLENYELYCDPLVHGYRMKELMFKGASPATTATKPMTPFHRMVPIEATPTMYRKVNQGDDLLTAFMAYNHMATSE